MGVVIWKGPVPSSNDVGMDPEVMAVKSLVAEEDAAVIVWCIREGDDSGFLFVVVEGVLSSDLVDCKTGRFQLGLWKAITPSGRRSCNTTDANIMPIPEMTAGRSIVVWYTVVKVLLQVQIKRETMKLL